MISKIVKSAADAVLELELVPQGARAFPGRPRRDRGVLHTDSPEIIPLRS